MLGRLAVRTKVVLGFGLILVLFLASVIFTYFSIGRAASASKAEQTSSEKLYLAAKASEGLVSRLSCIRGYLLTDKDEHLAQYEQSKQNFAGTMSQLRELLSTEEGTRLWQATEQASASYATAVDHAAELKKAGKSQEAESWYFSPEIGGMRKQLQGCIDAQTAHFRKEQAATVAQSQSILSLVKTLSLVLGIVGLLLGSAIAYVLGNWFSSVVKQIHGFVGSLSENNLAIPDLVSTGEDEVAEMQRALNRMKNHLHKVISAIAVTAASLASASEELSASANGIERASKTQHDQSIQVATAMQQMSATVREVSVNSSKASTNANASRELAIDGGKTVEETVNVITSVADSTRDTAAKVEHLGKSSEQIGKIIGVIDDIADQTNLLALNAAIEAARAGEQGRGFAVVADEVRKLAERTTSATKEISSMIETIQEETKNAVGAMRSGTERVDLGVRAASKAGDALKTIIESSKSMEEMVAQIATAATEQAAATEQVNENVGRIANMAQQSSAGAEQSAKACEGLSNLAMELQQMVSGFNLGQIVQRAPIAKASRQSGAQPHAIEAWQSKEQHASVY